MTLTVHINFEMPSYVADPRLVKPLFDAFRPVHAGKVSPSATTGFIDATLISGAHGTQFMCLSPEGGNGHARDEYVVISSLLNYRDCMVELFKYYKV